jgi:hypothetical protein
MVDVGEGRTTNGEGRSRMAGGGAERGSEQRNKMNM